MKFFFRGIRAYDRAAIKFRGVDADINFNLSDYEEDMKQVRNVKNLCLFSTKVNVFKHGVLYCLWTDVDEELE